MDSLLEVVLGSAHIDHHIFSNSQFIIVDVFIIHDPSCHMHMRLLITAYPACDLS